MSTKKILKIACLILFLLIVIISATISILYAKQDKIIQELISTVNQDFVGRVEIEDSHISPFDNFPYISIDLEHLKIYENKESKNTILHISDCYIGFDLWTIITGNFEIKSLLLKNGVINLIQHTDGEFNLTKALTKTHEIEDIEEEFHLDLKKIELDHVDITKLNEETNLLFDVYITRAKSKFKTSNEHTYAHLDSKFELSVITNGDTTFVNHKHFDLTTDIDFINATQILTILPSNFLLEGASFNTNGTVDFDDDMNVDLSFSGNKPNFDLFIAFAPNELIPTLKKYENKGKVYFDATVKGKSINGHNPKLDANFGCSEAYFTNTINNKKLDDLQFKGHFTNGDKRDASTMEFSMQNFSAKPEAGIFSGNLLVKNFDAPEIDLKLNSHFELEFLATFLNINNLQNLEGSIDLEMNFRDIIDLEHPEKSIEKLNESYYTKLVVKNLGFTTPDFHLPVKDLNIYATMDGHKANISQFDIKIGKSDMSFKGTVSDLPAILHHTNKEVYTSLNFSSKFIDVYELTFNKKDSSKIIDEQIENFKMDLAFKSSAKAMTESPNLPIGEFFIKNLYAKFKHYPHTLHDFHADVFVEEKDFRIIDFTGEIDKSDFHFAGKLKNYDLWFAEHPKGDTKIEFNLDSKLLKLEDLFAYKNENYIPEDYQHEELKNTIIHGFADLHFSEGLKSADVYIDKLNTTMKIHPMRFEKFSGRVHIENEHLTIEKLTGKLGKSSFLANMTYYYGSNKALKKKDNKLYLQAQHLDFDELFSYNPPPPSKQLTPQDHEDVFNIFALPFTDMSFHFDIKHLNYHRYLLHDFNTKFRMQENHYIYLDTLSLVAAGGNVNMSGYFNGSNKDNIYFSPKMNFKNVDIDKLLFKFENFGQDHLVSENLHGKLSGKLTGKIHLHADMIPIIDDSEIHVDLNVVNGKLENFGPMEYMSDYFTDKNLTKVIFDTLSNHIDIKNGVTTIPRMLINSSLGFIEISGKQDMNMNIEYYLSVPVKMIAIAGMNKLFGKKNTEIDPEQEDEIVSKDDSKKVRYVNVKISGTVDDYKITLGKDKNKA